MIILSSGLQGHTTERDGAQATVLRPSSRRYGHVIVLPIPKIGIEVIHALELFVATTGVLKIAATPALNG
jgi:hypothetical protein